MTIQYSPSSDMDWLNMLIYGPFGSGKTVLAATAEMCEDTAHVFFADAEGGTKSLRDLNVKNLDVFRINTFQSFARLYDFARNHARLRDILTTQKPGSAEYKETKEKLIRLEAWVKGIPDEEALKQIKEPKLYRTIVVDSLTEVQKYNMYDILGIDINTSSFSGDVATPQLQHWGKNSEKMRLLVRQFRDIPMHTIFCCLDATVKDEKDGSVTIKPSLPGKLADEVCGFLDIVGYMHVREETDPVTGKATQVRYLQVQPAGKFNAKSRYRALGDYIKNPTVGKMVDMIKNPVTASTPETAAPVTAATTDTKIEKTEGGK